MWKSTPDKGKVLKNIEIVLVSPGVPENIGLVARVLKNTSFSGLSLINPRLTSKSFDVAKRARDVLKQAKIFDSLESALSSSHFVFGTTRRPREYKFIHSFDDIKLLLLSVAVKKKVSIVFGKEDFGLSQRDIALCDSIFYLPANVQFPSYNLAFSVGIVCYEIFNLVGSFPHLKFLDLARRKDIENLFLYLEKYICRFSDKKRLASTMLSLRRLFLRTHLAKNEVSLLKSLIPKTVQK